MSRIRRMPACLVNKNNYLKSHYSFLLQDASRQLFIGLQALISFTTSFGHIGRRISCLATFGIALTFLDWVSVFKLAFVFVLVR